MTGKEVLAQIESGNRDLRGADLRYADLSNANLSDANLSNADLSNANLSDANLRYANLSDADLRNANLSDANLSNADLRYANLSDANLSDANLSNANLSNANLSDANLSNVRANEVTAGYWSICPEVGAFDAYAKKSGTIVKLRIPAKAARSSATTRKCRAEYAKVLRVYNEYREVTTDGYYGPETVYKEGEYVYPDSWDTDRWNECSHGIHFFMTRKEAENWG